VGREFKNSPGGRLVRKLSLRFSFIQNQLETAGSQPFKLGKALSFAVRRNWLPGSGQLVTVRCADDIQKAINESLMVVWERLCLGRSAGVIDARD
jgi:hypothetical protein